MGGRYEIGQAAYVKLVLHALKHAASPVSGLLLGRSLPDNTVSISDAVALSHSTTGVALLPALELALLQVEERFGAEGLSVVGCYHANERFADRDLSGVARRIGDHISRYFPCAALLLIDNKKLQGLLREKGREPVLQLYTKDSKNWTLAGSDGICELKFKEPAANVILLDYVSSEKYKDIVDFDDHLDDISKNWLNPDLFKKQDR